MWTPNTNVSAYVGTVRACVRVTTQVQLCARHFKYDDLQEHRWKPYDRMHSWVEMSKPALAHKKTKRKRCRHMRTFTSAAIAASQLGAHTYAILESHTHRKHRGPVAFDLRPVQRTTASASSQRRR